MGIRQVIECDVCGKQKEQSNHWFMAETNAKGPMIGLYPIKPTAYANLPTLKIICGEACVIKYVSQNLASLHPQRAPLGAPCAEPVQEGESNVS